MNDCIFNENLCSSYGINQHSYGYGAAFHSIRSICDICKCNFSSNNLSVKNEYSYNYGGAFAVSSSNGTISNCFFDRNEVLSSGNYPAGYGGALFISTSNFIVLFCNFTNNKIMYKSSLIDGYGGAIRVEYSDIKIFNSFFASNNTNRGGSIHSIDSNLIMNDCFLNNNDGLSGSNIFSISNPNNIYIFEFLSDYKIICECKKNCIVPYDNQYYSCGSTGTFYDETGQNLNTFENAFMMECILETSQFTVSSAFSNSYEFTISSVFSNSNEITPSFHFSDSNIFTKLNSFSLTHIHTEMLNEQTILMSYSLTDVTVKTVIYSYLNVQSNTFLLSYNEEYQTYFASITESNFHQYIPYIIYSLSKSYVETMLTIEIVKKKSLSPENLIGISCGSVAAVFLIFFIIISVYRMHKNEFIFSEVTESASDENLSDHQTAIEQNVETHLNNNNENNDNLDLWI